MNETVAVMPVISHFLMEVPKHMDIYIIVIFFFFRFFYSNCHFAKISYCKKRNNISKIAKWYIRLKNN